MPLLTLASAVVLPLAAFAGLSAHTLQGTNTAEARALAESAATSDVPADLSEHTLQRTNTTEARALAESAATSDIPRPTHLMWDPLKFFCMFVVGVEVRIFECDDTWETAGQNLYFDKNRQLRLHGAPEYCLVIDGHGLKHGARIVLWSCDDPEKEHSWEFRRRGQIMALGTPEPMCMGVEGNSAVNGAHIVLSSCSARSSNTQDWIQLSLSPDRTMMYAEPNADRACPSPFVPVVHGTAECVIAADTVRPGSGCRFGGGPLLTWSQVVREIDEPSQPEGCYVYGACQGGCSLHSNPTGFADPSRSGSGTCFYLDVICGLACKRRDIVA